MGACEMILAELKRGDATAKDIVAAVGVTLQHAHAELRRLSKGGRAHVAVIRKRGHTRVGSVYRLGPAPPGFKAAVVDDELPRTTIEDRGPRVNSVWQLADLARGGR